MCNRINDRIIEMKVLYVFMLILHWLQNTNKNTVAISFNHLYDKHDIDDVILKLFRRHILEWMKQLEK